ncbi:MAG: hypothetical protein KDC35_18510 [Acidobacteria bacterium]|nr:hypothetical protein [Acidobacteriota bacterium]
MTFRMAKSITGTRLVRSVWGTVRRMINRDPQLVAVVIISILVTFAVFRGVFFGNILSNVNYMYNFQPFASAKELPDNRGNTIMSDVVDGYGTMVFEGGELRRGTVRQWTYANQLGSVGVFNIFNFLCYPLRTVTWLVFGVPYGWTIEILLRFVIGVAFTFLFLRKLGIYFPVGLAVSLGYVFSASNMSHYERGFSIVSLTAPIAFYAAERLFSSDKWRDVIWLALSLACLGLAGFLSVIFYFSYILAAYMAVRILCSPGRRWSLGIKVTVSGILAGMLISIPLASTFDFIAHSIDLAYREDYGLWQIPWTSFWHAFYAHMYGHPLADIANWPISYINTSIFIGYLAISAALSAAVLRLIMKFDHKILIWFVFALWLAPLIYMFPFETSEAWTNQLPLFKGNAPYYQKTVFHFVLAVLGGYGLDFLWRLSGSKRWLCTAIILVAVATWTWYATDYFLHALPKEPTRYTSIYGPLSITMNVIGFAMLGAIGLTQFAEKRWRSKWLLGTIMVVFGVLEIGLHTNNWVSYAKRRMWFPEFEFIQYLKDELKGSRVVTLDYVAVPAILQNYGIPVAAGRLSLPKPYLHLVQLAYADAYVAMPTQAIFPRNQTDINHPIWELADVKCFLTYRGITLEKNPDWQLQFTERQFPGVNILTRKRDNHHGFLPSDGVIHKDSDAMVHDFKEQWDIHANISLANPSGLVPGDESTMDMRPQSAGTITDYQQGPDVMTYHIKTHKPGYLVASSYFHRNWKATIDGKPISTIRAYGFLLAVPVSEPGDHILEFKYRPPYLTCFVVLTMLSISVLMAMFWAGFKEHTRQNAVAVVDA